LTCYLTVNSEATASVSCFRPLALLHPRDLVGVGTPCYLPRRAIRHLRRLRHPCQCRSRVPRAFCFVLVQTASSIVSGNSRSSSASESAAERRRWPLPAALSSPPVAYTCAWPSDPNLTAWIRSNRVKHWSTQPCSGRFIVKPLRSLDLQVCPCSFVPKTIFNYYCICFAFNLMGPIKDYPSVHYHSLSTWIYLFVG
jgi:hypothetical protein